MYPWKTEDHALQVLHDKYLVNCLENQDTPFAFIVITRILAIFQVHWPVCIFTFIFRKIRNKNNFVKSWWNNLFLSTLQCKNPLQFQLKSVCVNNTALAYDDSIYLCQLWIIEPNQRLLSTKGTVNYYHWWEIELLFSSKLSRYHCHLPIQNFQWSR